MIQLFELNFLNMQEEKLNFLNFSGRLLSLMSKSEYTQKELAERWGVSEGSVINWKRGKLPKSEELFKIAASFSVSMEWLLTGEDGLPTPQLSEVDWRERCRVAEEKLDGVGRLLHDAIRLTRPDSPQNPV